MAGVAESGTLPTMKDVGPMSSRLDAKALKKAQCEGVKTTVCNWRLHFAGALQRTSNKRTTRRVMVWDHGW